MNLTERDRKIAIAVLPILLLVGYWFLLLAPKRDAAAQASKELTKQTERRDKAQAAANTARGAQTDFAADYAEIVRLGKAIPAGVDMPSLLVQLDRAAAGTDIRFTKVAQGQRTDTAAPASTAPTTDNSTSAPVEAGGATAQSAPGSAVESANNTAQTASTQADAASQSGVDATTSTSTSTGGLPVGGGATNTAAPAAAGTGPAGLETMPLDLEFVGNFFDLADFFHSVKRFVRVANQNVVVSGRLVTVEGVKFSSDPQIFPRVKAEMTVTVYLSPKVQGTTAGATPQGPTPAPGAPTTPASTEPSSSPTTAAPTATATP